MKGREQFVAEALVALGWDEGWDEDWAAVLEGRGGPDREAARVVAEHRDRWMVLTAHGVTPARRVRNDLGGARPVTGDWVVTAPGPERADPWEIVAILPRRSAIRRGAAGSSRWEQVLAANVDRLWIVEALDAPPNLRRLERYLAVGWESGAAPEIVLTKSDLAQDLAGAVAAVESIAVGVPLWRVSIEDGGALKELEESLQPGRTVALIGPSGAGKSTLINRLAHSEVAGTGEVRPGDRKGRHTTTVRALFPIRNGALLLDTPGLRELKVLDVAEGLSRTFPEIEELARTCRFGDCSHSVEPGCAVRIAVEKGDLPPDRLASYRKLMAEAAFERRKDDPVARAAHLAEYKTAMKTMKHHLKRKHRE